MRVRIELTKDVKSLRVLEVISHRFYERFYKFFYGFSRVKQYRMLKALINSNMDIECLRTDGDFQYLLALSYSNTDIINYNRKNMLVLEIEIEDNQKDFSLYHDLLSLQCSKYKGATFWVKFKAFKEQFVKYKYRSQLISMTQLIQETESTINTLMEGLANE